MSTIRYSQDIMLFWGNVDSKFAPEEVMYESDNVFIVNFKLSIKDPILSWIQRCEKYMPNIQNISFQYIHKVSCIYNYIGPIDRLKIMGIYSGIAHIEFVVLKKGEDDCRRPEFVYPCSTKNDMCRLLKTPLLASNELVNKISKKTNRYI
jgi:hypothetical protein